MEAVNQPDACILAIDLGTSTCKVGLVTTSGEVVALESEPIGLHLLAGGGAEQDPDEWWEAIRKACGRLLGSTFVGRRRIIAVACTAQWSGTVAVDRHGRPLRRAIIWMDSRGAPYARRITRGPINIQGYGVDKLWRWVRKTAGIPAASGKDSIAHILYIKYEEPDIYRLTYKFLEPKDYLNLRLTGQLAASYDSIALHWVTDNRNPSAVCYDGELLRLAGVHREKLPDLKGALEILGGLQPQAALELGLEPGIPVVVGTPDVQSAALGSGATRDYQAHLYVGTSSWLTCHVPYKKTDLFRNMATLPSAIPGRYFVANEQETAGACLTFLRDNILFYSGGLGSLQPGGLPGQASSPPVNAYRTCRASDAYRIFDELAAQAPPGSGGVIFTPWLYGERTPVEDRLVRGGFYNLALATTLPHLVRAVYEGVAYNTRWLLEAVEAFVRRRLDPIRIVGGGARSDVWCQIFADVLNRSIERVADPLQANVRGTALLAAVALQRITFEEVADRVAIASVYRPRPENRQRYDQLYRAFRRLYRTGRRIYADLNRPGCPLDGRLGP